MSDPAILFVKPGAISKEDKALLVAAGIVVVEIEKPQDAKFVRAAAELDGNELLRCAMEGMRGYDTAARDFGKAIIAAIAAKQPVSRQP